MDFATILNPLPDKHRVSVENDPVAQAKLTIGPFATDALVLVTASGFADYSGPVSNAGIILRILVDQVDLSEADSFEGEFFEYSFQSVHGVQLPTGRE